MEETAGACVCGSPSLKKGKIASPGRLTHFALPLAWIYSKGNDRAYQRSNSSGSSGSSNEQQQWAEASLSSSLLPVRTVASRKEGR